MLTYEQGTPLDKERQKGDLNPMDDSLVCNLFETTIEFLSTCGYTQYEISNFSRCNSNKSRHNRKYWSFIPYMGFGPSAHSFLESERCWNCRSVKRYIEDLNMGKMPVEEREALSKEQRMIETICSKPLLPFHKGGAVSRQHNFYVCLPPAIARFALWRLFAHASLLEAVEALCPKRHGWAGRSAGSNRN